MTKNLNFIGDYETLSQDQFTCIAFNYAYFLFDWDRFTKNPYTAEELLDSIQVAKFDVSEQKKLGWKTQKKTVEWWMSQEKEVKMQALPSEDDITLEDFKNKLNYYLNGIKVNNYWNRGCDFDPVIFKRMMIAADNEEIFEKNLPYWSLMDVRSFINGSTDFKYRNDFVPMEDEDKWNRIFKKHNSKHDVMADILRLQIVTRLRNGLDI